MAPATGAALAGTLLLVAVAGAGGDAATPAARWRRMQQNPGSTCGQLIQRASPQCAVCGPPPDPPPEVAEACMYDIESCRGLRPGESCEVRCRAPYRQAGAGVPMVARCPSGNSIPNRMLQWPGWPECHCPEPSGQYGYVQSPGGAWECSVAGFPKWTGTPSISCSVTQGGAATTGATTTATATTATLMDTTAGEAGINTTTATTTPAGTAAATTAASAGPRSCVGATVRSSLHGCQEEQPCAIPHVDLCLYDISTCTGVWPGDACEIRCRHPFVGNPTTATCPPGNVDPLRMLEYFPLSCVLDSCPDPAVPPEGYVLTDAGWECAAGYAGTAMKRCAPNSTWGQDCGAVALLDGCERMVNCAQPVLQGLDTCRYDVAACQSVAPGESCDVHCKVPSRGESTIAFCPSGNTNAAGLNWTTPSCEVTDCPEPDTTPTGYTPTQNGGWVCANGYYGFAYKRCRITPTCEPLPEITGCSRLEHCVAPDLGCTYDVASCLSVPAGAACTIGCRAPFAGGTVPATCPQGNVDPNGLTYDSLPECSIDRCPDPSPWPQGYMRGSAGWSCASGYVGYVARSCSPVAGSCSTQTVLTGCVPEVPCKALTVLGHGNNCKVDVSACGSIMAGSSCEVRCRADYPGSPGTARCPAGNIDPETELEWSMPECECGDPINTPSAYTKLDGVWQCAPGYSGQASKQCRPGATCEAQPELRGCEAPLACSVSEFEDDGSGNGRVRGRFHFGPAVANQVIDESNIGHYNLYLADRCHAVMGQVVATVQTTAEVPACCQFDAYTAEIPHVPLHAGAMGFLLKAVVNGTESPLGRFVGFDPADASRHIQTASAHRPPGGAAAVAAVTLAMLVPRLSPGCCG